MKETDDIVLFWEESDGSGKKPEKKPEVNSARIPEIRPEKKSVRNPEMKKREAVSNSKKRFRAPGGASRKKGSHLAKRIALSVGTFLALFLCAVVVACYILLNGPSETMRDALVLSAKQASATKWIPGLFLSRETVQKIEENSKTVTYDVISLSDTKSDEQNGETEDEWADAIEGIRLVRIAKPTFKAYLMMIRDPSRVFVGVSSDFKSGKYGMRIFEIADKYNAVAAINGGEFPDEGGVGDGGSPIGITYSQGKLVYSGHTNRTFMGFTEDNRLVISEGMTEKKAKELKIRDGVCFQTGNGLITNDGVNMTVHYSDGNTGRAQRTAIGQRADGTVLFLVTDGRTASSLGATHNDLIKIMLEYGAISAGKLDGGSSAQMYYRNYFDLYGIDQTTLDEYQRKGLVNTYKAFTPPRRLPTFFVVGEEQ